MPNGKTNLCNVRNFDLACQMLKANAPDNTFTIQNIWMDYGAGMMWETIICVRPDGSSYQVLNPRDWDLLDSASEVEDIIRVVAGIIKDQRQLLRVPEGRPTEIEVTADT